MRKKYTVLLFYFLIMPLFGKSNSKLELTTRQVSICNEKLVVEIANTYESRKRGLMFRKKLAFNRGMLFEYKHPRVLYFWMKNTYIDLDIGFFDKDKILRVIKTMKKLDETVVSSGILVMYALEVNKGWFKAKNISIGCRLKFLD